MTIPQKIAQVQFDREANDRQRDFVNVIKFMMLGRGAAQAARLAQEARAPARVVQSLEEMIVSRAAQDPMSISSVGDQLAPFQILANAFAASLVNSAFDRMLPSMLKFPLRTRIIGATSMITGSTLGEMAVKRVSSLSLTAGDLEIGKTGAVIVVSKELLVAGPDGTDRYLETELKSAVSVATDAAFLALITAGATSIPSSGSNAAAMRLDVRALAQSITIGAASRLFLITTPDLAVAMATIGDSAGGAAFANAKYNGGDAGGIPILVSDGCTAGEVILADASGIAAAAEAFRVDSSGITSVQMDTAPDSPPTASTNMLNLWTQNLAAVRVERYFGAKVVRSNSVAKITGATWAGSSP